MEYRYIIEDATQGSNAIIQNGAKSTIKNSPNEDPTFADGFGKKALNTVVSRTVLSPLNSATGGLATPFYGLGKSIYSGLMNGFSAGAVGGAAAGVLISGINLVINKLQERMAKLEAEAAEKNYNDNILIRAGSKGFATHYYSTIAGVKRKTDRS